MVHGVHVFSVQASLNVHRVLAWDKTKWVTLCRRNVFNFGCSYKYDGSGRYIEHCEECWKAARSQMKTRDIEEEVPVQSLFELLGKRVEELRQNAEDWQRVEPLIKSYEEMMSEIRRQKEASLDEHFLLGPCLC